MGQQQCSPDSPMWCVPEFLPGIVRPPRQRNASQFVPTARHDPKAASRFAQGRSRKLVVRRDKGLRPRKTGPEQQPGSFVEPIRNAGAIDTVELHVIVMQSMLNDFKALVLAQIVDQLCVCPDG